MSYDDPVVEGAGIHRFRAASLKARALLGELRQAFRDHPVELQPETVQALQRADEALACPAAWPSTLLHGTRLERTGQR